MKIKTIAAAMAVTALSVLPTGSAMAATYPPMEVEDPVMACKAGHRGGTITVTPPSASTPVVFFSCPN